MGELSDAAGGGAPPGYEKAAAGLDALVQDLSVDASLADTLRDALGTDRFPAAFVVLARALVPCDRIAVATPEANDEELVLELLYDADPAARLASGGRLPVVGSHPGRAFAGGLPVIAPELKPRYIESEALAASGLSSGLAVPIRAGERVAGILTVASRQADAYTSDHVSVLSRLADLLFQVAAAGA